MAWLDWIRGKKKKPAEGRRAVAGVAGAAQHERVSAAEWAAIGWERDAQGDSAGALVAFGKALEREPRVDAYYGRGVVHCKLRRYPAAIADLSRAVELRPRFAGALTERGLAYVAQGDIEKGIAEYDAAIAVDPSYAMAHENKGSACLMLERWAEALTCLDMALRLDPANGRARYHRGIAHEMLGSPARAIRDYQDALESPRTGVLVPHARQRLEGLQAHAGEVSALPRPAPEDLWTQLVALTLEDTVADLVRKVHDEGAFFGLVALPEGGRTVAAFYGKDGLRRHLTEVADVIGPRILELKLGQLHALLPGPAAPPERSDDDAGGDGDRDGDGERLIEGSSISLIMHDERVLGVFSGRIVYHYPDLPTAIFGERPRFERSESGETARRCGACGRAVAYFDAILEEDKLAGYACPGCGASPIEGWVEERMRPGAWSRAGFLGKTEVLREVVARDEATLARLGVDPARIADALDRLIGEALRASAERIARATARFEDELRGSGMRGVPGLAILPLGDSLDELEARLGSGKRLPGKRGTAIDGHDVYLDVYLGYQHCPYTSLRRPWSDDPPPREVVRRQVDGAVHLTAPTDSRLPCREGLWYRHANLELLVVRRGTGEWLRCAGLLAHLIRDHRFFEGAESSFRLDPERAARVLGLS